MSRTLINTQTSSWPGAAVVGGSRASCVVCARWCPTLPHPGGCSTIGAVRLSFRVRDGCRAFPCRCDHRDGCWQCCAVLCVVDSVVCGRPPTATHPGVVWLGGGLGVDRIVDASRLTALFPLFPFVPFLPPCGGRAGGWGGGCCLCRPISTSQLEAVTGLPLLAYQPSSLLGAYQDTEVSCGDLILKMVSRLDAFSGYPSRT